MPLSAGDRLGPYQILSPAGIGGQGEVYGAKDTRLDRVVAVKVLPADVAADPAARERFEREARAVAALNHPHICVLHDVGRHEGTDFLVMECLEGETLGDRLSRGALSLPQALEYAACRRYPSQSPKVERPPNSALRLRFSRRGSRVDRSSRPAR
jgi:serine/threonine protein kinase